MVHILIFKKHIYLGLILYTLTPPRLILPEYLLVIICQLRKPSDNILNLF